ncbi:MAG: DUF2779 domain-containing protein [Actinobacteria bacterium]|nr:DUF2779 domain-containing protein [Actinomycetota bacterium]
MAKLIYGVNTLKNLWCGGERINDKIISKSKYLAGLQYQKYLWYLFNAPDQIPPYDEISLFRFKQGYEVAKLARSLFPDGIEVRYAVEGIEGIESMERGRSTGDVKHLESQGSLGGIEEELIATKKLILMKEKRPIFEAAFLYRNSFARADVLEPAETDEWNIIEIKSATSIKDINKHDVAFQKYCYEGAGLRVNKCYIMYLNKDYKRSGQIDPQALFLKRDVTEEVEVLKENVEENIRIMLKFADLENSPEPPIGKNCYTPYECPLREFCWSFLPENNIFELYRGKDLACLFYQKGITSICGINEEETSMLTPVQRLQYESVKRKREFVDVPRLRCFFEKLRFPLYFLDFETFATAIPLFDGLSPYQNVPFQFSCHVLESLDGEPQNFYFLADGKSDPRIDFLRSLKKTVTDTQGSIIVYYENFEKTILQELAIAFPQERLWIEDVISRIVDLYEPFGSFYYYHPRQKGSASLKNVLPALTGISYDEMEIKNGEEASLKYLTTTFLSDSHNLSGEDIEKIRKALLEYCDLDTRGMIYILRNLRKVVE